MGEKRGDEVMDEVISIRTENGIQNMGAEEFNKTIISSLNSIEELNRQYQIAVKSANKAKDRVKNAEIVAKEAKKGAEAAQEESKRVNALSNSTFFIFNNSETIKQMKEGYYNLASSQKDIADALIDISEVQSSLSQAQTDSMEALRVSFEINKSIAQVSQYLFILGCQSIAASQTVCRSLEMKLRNASEEEISEFARKELQSVVDNLKSQESIMRKQEQMAEDLVFYADAIKENRDNISVQQKKLSIQEDELHKRAETEKILSNELQRQEEINSKQEEDLEKQRLADEEHDRRLEEGDKKDAEQDEILKKQVEKDEEHDLLLKEALERDAEHDLRLKENAKKDEEHDRRLNEGDEKDARQDESLALIQKQIAAAKEELKRLDLLLGASNKDTSNSISDIKNKMENFASKKQVYIAWAIAIISLIIGIGQFIH